MGGGVTAGRPERLKAAEEEAVVARGDSEILRWFTSFCRI